MWPNLKNAVLSHPDVVAFKTAFQNAFGDFDAYLKSALIDGMTQLNAAGEEERLSRGDLCTAGRNSTG